MSLWNVKAGDEVAICRPRLGTDLREYDYLSVASVSRGGVKLSDGSVWRLSDGRERGSTSSWSRFEPYVLRASDAREREISEREEMERQARQKQARDALRRLDGASVYDAAGRRALVRLLHEVAHDISQIDVEHAVGRKPDAPQGDGENVRLAPARSGA